MGDEPDHGSFDVRLSSRAPVAGTVSGGVTGYFDSYTFDIAGNRTT